MYTNFIHTTSLFNKHPYTDASLYFKLSFLTAASIDFSTENTIGSITTPTINRGNKISKNVTIPQATIRGNSPGNRSAGKNSERGKQLLIALSSKSYISKPNSTTPTPVKLSKRAGSAAEIKQKVYY